MPPDAKYAFESAAADECCSTPSDPRFEVYILSTVPHFPKVIKSVMR